jgi:tRNA/tmRNA/rRNA uracil-C5-methylase (TrmA/RlmC/RlmD family)
MLSPGTVLALTIEKPVAGGRMIARHDGEVVLVSGAIPGERVTARIEGVVRGVAHASVVDVLEPSPHRRPAGPDPRCGGNVYSHIAYDAQRRLKAAVVADALARIARVTLTEIVPVAGSIERGYRMRARFHVRDGQVGFFREGTHGLCDPASSGQLQPEACEMLARLSGRLEGVEEIELAENITGDMRAAHLRVVPEALGRASRLANLVERAGLNGVSASSRLRLRPTTLAGRPWVSDPVSRFTGAGPGGPSLRRHAHAFFQSNRYLVPALVSRVVAWTRAPVMDLYSGVGLFAVALAAAGRPVVAVEDDPDNLDDLEENARPFEGLIEVRRSSVERFLSGFRSPHPETVIVDPPRLGLSRAAISGLVAMAPPVIVYVSCDVATLARDVRLLGDAGWILGAVEAFDLFPNTAHVEVVASLTRLGR